jgi:NhaA family Na+:H+ antiporter
MSPQKDKLSHTFNQFFESEKTSGILLIIVTALAITISNSSFGHDYLNLWQTRIGNLSLEHWINDGLMAMFFLLIGLELEREIYVGELSNLKHALLPIVAALGGMVAPALIHFSLNQGTTTQAGIGIPMATDIAFALGALAILGNRIPASLKVFIVAFAVMDDLGAIVIIAAFYTAKLTIVYLAGALLVWGLLITMNRIFKVMALLPYLLGGVVMWIFMLNSGIHATVAGIMLAFAIPFSAIGNKHQSPSDRLEHILHKPVAFIILPLFALANTNITIDVNSIASLMSMNSLGIAGGLIIGKPLGITLFCLVAVVSGICSLPADLKWPHIIGAGILGGIGFTMSIFISNLAFNGDIDVINATKIAILVASIFAGLSGFLWLRFLGNKPIKRPPAVNL